ncbi:Protein of unknown function [Bacillus cereus]|nr:Protein of unknown function [Bacillus cereus]
MFSNFSFTGAIITIVIIAIVVLLIRFMFKSNKQK